jgi:hypothetical protein
MLFTSSIINYVSRLATSENMPLGLKITYANNQTFSNLTLFAGVDIQDNDNNKYDNNNNNNNKHKNDKNKHNNDKKQDEETQVNQDNMQLDNMQATGKMLISHK